MQSHARRGCHVKPVRKGTLHHDLVTFLRARKSLVMEINPKMIKMKLKVTSLVMPNMPARWENKDKR